jgi:hypothetical protein
MIDIALKNAEAYAARHELRIITKLGVEIHGTVQAVEDKIKPENSAVKAQSHGPIGSKKRGTDFGDRWRVVRAVMDAF